MAILVFSACIPAFAEEYSASSYTSAKTFSNTDSQGKSDIIYTERPFVDFPNETIELTNEEKLKIANDYIAQYGGMRRDSDREPDQYTVLCFKNLSNGMKLVYVRDNTIKEYNCLCAIVPLGKYVYHHGDGRSVKLYQNGVFTEFNDAYESGMINDAILSGTASKGDNPAPAIFIALAVATVAGIGIAAAKKSV